MNIVSNPIRGDLALPPMALAVSQEGSMAIPLIRRYLGIILRGRYLIMGCVLVAVLLSLVVTLLMTPLYAATTTIEIARDADRVTTFQGVERETNVADQEFYQTQYGLLRSKTLAQRVAVRLRLVDRPDFYKMFRKRADDRAFATINGRYVVQGRGKRQQIAAEILLANLAITPARLSRLVSVSFTSPDPAFSAKVADAWAESFIQTNLDRKVQATSYGRNLLYRELTQAKERLDESQRQLVAYASQQRIINLPAQGGSENGPGERSIVSDELAAINAALSQATADRIQAEARVRELGSAGATSEALRNLAINSLRQRRAELAADYQRLLTQFEPSYAPARALNSQIGELDRGIAREEARVVNAIRGDALQAVRRESVLRARVEGLKSDYLDLRNRSIQYNIFQQEVDTNRALYDGLLQRYKEIGVAGGVGVNNISIVDQAIIPDRPSSPRVVLNLALALVVGLAAGCLAALVLEQLDETIGDLASLERHLGIPALGMVPATKDITPEAALLDRKSAFVEAYLAVQTSLSFTTEHGMPQSLSVTSTRPAEGKSSTALALATILARGQSRVILIDADMRSPSIHQLIDVPHELGLSNFLAGRDDLTEMIITSTAFGFDAITAGPLPPNAAELLAGNRLSLLIEQLLQRYDHVIIDSPPVMGLADAPLIASKVEGVVFAIESHKIRLTLVKNALARLAGANTHIFGGILTKFESKRANSGYGYGYGYDYEYGRNAPLKPDVASPV